MRVLIAFFAFLANIVSVWSLPAITDLFIEGKTALPTIAVGSDPSVIQIRGTDFVGTFSLKYGGCKGLTDCSGESKTPKYTATNCQILSTELITCEAVSGVGYGLRVWYDFDDSGSGTWLPSGAKYTLSYASPIFKEFANSGEFSNSGEKREIVGENFGPVGEGTVMTMSMYKGLLISYDAITCTIKSDSAAECDLPPGIGINFEIFIVVDGAKSVDVSTDMKYASLSWLSYKITDKDETEKTTLNTNSAKGDKIIYSMVPVDGLTLSSYPGLIKLNGPNDLKTCEIVGNDVKCPSEDGVGKYQPFILEIADSPSSSEGNVSVITLNYSPPTITNVFFSQVGLDTAGGSSFSVEGDNFGPSISGITITYGPVGDLKYTGQNCVMNAAHTGILCTAEEGTGSNMNVKISIGGSQTFEYSGANMFYAAPIIMEFKSVGGSDPFSLNPNGGEQIILAGKNFGKVDSDIDFVKFGDEDNAYSCTGCTITTNHEEITCTIPSGSGTRLFWTISINGQESSYPYTSYAEATITSITAKNSSGNVIALTNLDPAGGDIVTITGSSLGAKSSEKLASDTSKYKPEYDVAYSPIGVAKEESYLPECWMETEQQVIKCTTKPGLGANHKWRVYVGTQPKTAPESTSYKVPTLGIITPSTLPTTGGQIEMTVSDLFNDLSTKYDVSFNGMTLEGTYVSAEGKILVTIPEGQGKEFDLKVSMRDKFSMLVESSNSLQFSYVNPEISEIVLTADSGSVFSYKMIITGTNFGKFVNGKRKLLLDGDEGKLAPESAQYSHTRISVNVLINDLNYNGSQFTGTVKLEMMVPCSTGECTVSDSETFVAILTTETSNSEIDDLGVYKTRFDTPAGGQLKISNTPLPTPVIVSLSSSEVPSTWTGSCAVVEGVASTVCTLPDGPGGTIKVSTTSAGQAGVAFYYRYNVPEITAIRTLNDETVIPTARTKIIIEGSNFGVDCSSPVYACSTTPIVTFGGQECTDVKIARNHEMITCLSPLAPGGIAVPVMVTVVDQVSSPVIINYQKPVLSAAFDQSTIDPAIGDPNKTSPFRLFGKNLGTNESLLSAEMYSVNGPVEIFCTRLPGAVYDRLEDGSFVINSDGVYTALKCSAPAGQGRNLPVSVTVNGQTSEETDVVFSYLRPTLEGLSPTNTANTSGLDVVLEVDNIKAEDTHMMSTSDRAIAEVTEANALARMLRFSLQDEAVSQKHLKAVGKNFGPEIEVLFDGAKTTLLYLPVTDGDGETQRQTFVIPAGCGSKDIVIRAPAGETDPEKRWDSAESVTFQYAAPQILRMEPRRAPTAGCSEWDNEKAKCVTGTESTVTFWGYSMGSPDVRDACIRAGRALVDCEPQVQMCSDLAYTDCVDVAPVLDDSWTHNTLSAEVAPGVGVDYYFQVRWGSSGEWVGIQESDRFSYDRPEINGVKTSVDGYNANGGLITLLGKNFGSTPSPVTIDIDKVSCQNATWVATATGAAELECFAPQTTVGFKNITLLVANQRTVIERESEVLLASCYSGWYGQTGEECLPCCQNTDDPDFSNVYESSCEDDSDCNFDGMVCSTGKCKCIRGGKCAAGLTHDSCPNCERHYVEPVSRSGWWKELLNTTDDSADDLCFNERLNSRDECQFMAPCDPTESCTGSNQCLEGYEFLKYKCEDEWTNVADKSCTSDADCNGGKECELGSPEACATCDLSYVRNEDKDAIVQKGQCVCGSSNRCAKCTVEEFFRENNECIRCPSNVWLIIAMFVIGMVFLCVMGYILNKRSISLPLLSIGVDYFQVLAIFRRADVAWPGILTDIFRMFSLFNFNLDLSAPECIAPEFDFFTKFLMVQALPLAACCIFLMVHFMRKFYFKCVLKRGRTNVKNASVLTSVVLVTMYYLYLYLLRIQLDVFNCSPTDPSDGHDYTTFSSPECDGLCRCWESGGIQMKLVPLAAVTFLIYSVGFPLLVFLMLRGKRHYVLMDQILRAYGASENRVFLGDDCYLLRKKFSRLYYQFRPECWYWILFIIGRKFGVATASLLFHRNPSFQLAMCLLVIFASYALHVRFLPYMSQLEEVDVREAYKSGQHYGLHPRHENELRCLVDKVNEHKANIRRNKRTWENRSKFSARSTTGKSLFWLTNYNTVETIMLSCMVFINLAGIMFESGQFDINASYYHTQRDILTGATMAVLVGSMVYYVIVLILDMLSQRDPAFMNKLADKFGIKDKSLMSASNRRSMRLKSHSNDFPSVGIEESLAVSQMQSNPMMKGGDSKPKETPGQLQQTIQTLREEIAKLRAEAATKRTAEQSNSARNFEMSRRKKTFGYVAPRHVQKAKRNDNFNINVMKNMGGSSKNLNSQPLPVPGPPSNSKFPGPPPGSKFPGPPPGSKFPGPPPGSKLPGPPSTPKK